MDKRYYAFRTKKTNEILFVVDMTNWDAEILFVFEIDDCYTLTNGPPERRSYDALFLQNVYDIKPITVSEKETYCDAFKLVALYKDSDIAVISLGGFISERTEPDRGSCYWELIS